MSRRGFAGGAGLVVLTWLAYLPAIRGGFLWDDDAYLTANPLVTMPGGLWRILFRPLDSPQYYPAVFLTFRGEYLLWGFQPAGYHAVNVALHASNAVLAWRACSRLLPAGAWLAGALFAVHPVQVESVAWIAERKNVLSAFFYLSALLAYWRFDPPTGSTEGRDRPKASRIAYVASFLLYLAALGSKTVTCSMPAAILLVAWWKRGRIGWRDVVPLVPFFVVGLAAGSITSWMEKVQVGATGPEWDIPAIDRCLIAGRALWFYAGKLAWPSRLSFIYPRWRVDPSAWWQDAFPLTAIAALAILWGLRGRIGRGPVVGALFFAGTLLPALGFFNVYPMRYSFVADHFQYLAGLGLIVPAARAISTAARHLDRLRPRAGSTVVGVGLMVLVVLTFARSGTFHDPTTLWTDTLSKDPDCWLAHNQLGTILVSRGKLEESKAHFLAALRARPDYAKAHFNLGSAHEKLGELEAARAHLLETVRLEPKHWEAHLILALIARRQGNPREAREQLRETLRYCPDDPAAKGRLSRLFPEGDR